MSLSLLLVSARTALVERLYEKLAAAGYGTLKPAHGWALFYVGSGGTTTAGLARQLGMSRQGAGKLVDSLLQHGYIQQTPHPDDRRSYLLFRTSRGENAYRLQQQYLTDLETEWTARFGAPAIESLRSTLELITRTFYGSEVLVRRQVW